MNATISSVSLNQAKNKYSPFSHYAFAWPKLWKFFLELLLVAIISTIIEAPSFSLWDEKTNFLFSNSVKIDLLFLSFEGKGALLLIGICLYVFLVLPLEYGISYIHLLAIREDKFKVTEIFKVFDNYWNAVFANILVSTIIGFGIMMLVIPGIIFACKLSFVSYLVVDKKMDAIEAIKKSWEMTNGFSGVIFLIGLFSFFVFLLGLIAFIVGVVIAIMWIRLAFASTYHSLDTPENVEVIT